MMTVEKEKHKRHAEGLLNLLSKVMSEDGSDKASPLYQSYRKLDAVLRDKLYPALNRYGLGEGPDVVRYARQMLERIETACRYPELVTKPLVRLVPPFINEGFSGKSLGLIKPIPEIGCVKTIIPILAINGPKLKIEYVNFADCRREITPNEYGNLIRWSSQMRGLRINRLVKNFIVTSPDVMPWAALFVMAEGYEHGAAADRLSMFVGQTFVVSKTMKKPFLYPQSTYLGLREQYEMINVLVRGGLLRDEMHAQRVNRAINQDMTRLMGGSDADREFLGKFQQEAKGILSASKECLGVMDSILKEAEIHLEDIRHILHDVFRPKDRRFPKRLPTKPPIVHYALCKIVESYEQSRMNPAQWIEKMVQYGIDPENDVDVQEAIRRGRSRANDEFVDTEELVKEGERKIKARKVGEPLKPTDVQLVPYKMAASFGSLDALQRLASIFYNAGRYSYRRKLNDKEEIAEAKALKYVLERLIDKDIDSNENRIRITHIRKCLGEFEEPEIVRTKRRQQKTASTPTLGGALSYLDGLVNGGESSFNGKKLVSEYDESADYSTRSSDRRRTSSGCFVTTAAARCLSIGRFQTAKAFVLLKRLRDERMMGSDTGRVLLSAYYRAAPSLVEELDSSIDSVEIYRSIWSRYIDPTCVAIRGSNLVLAERLYTQMVEVLLFTPKEDLLRALECRCACLARQSPVHVLSD